MEPVGKSCSLLIIVTTLLSQTLGAPDKELLCGGKILESLRATCCNGHLYLCKIEKIDFLKICQEEGFYQLVSKL